MAQVIIDYDEYQRLLKSDFDLAGAKMAIAHFKTINDKLTKELSLLKAELSDLKTTKGGY